MNAHVQTLRALLYPCNLVDYGRIVLLAYAASTKVLLGGARQPQWIQPVVLLIILASLALDLLDGYLARKLGHVTRMGAVLDMTIDLVTHTFVWSLSNSYLALAPIMLEWGAGLAVMLGAQSDTHWKHTMSERGPPLIRIYFSNHQRNLLSALANISHTAFPLALYLDPVPSWVHWIALPGVLLYEIVTAYMLYLSIKAKLVPTKHPAKTTGPLGAAKEAERKRRPSKSLDKLLPVWIGRIAQAVTEKVVGQDSYDHRHAR